MANLNKVEDYSNKSILITGGTGSFGNSFVKFLLDCKKPKRVIIFSRDEQKQYQMSLKFNSKKYPNLRFFIGDVRDLERLKMAMNQVDYVVHAAAMKHVSIAEYNPFECIKTNVIGAQNIVLASLHNKVQKVLALSTDKACNPSNLYGASKLAADKIFINANNIVGDMKTAFSVVRYGNVLGSQGSVLPFFQKLIKDGNTSFPITDKNMTRFWISLRQAVKFVNTSIFQSSGGEIFIPKIPSLHVTDLASFLDPNIKHKYIGIKPGEKIFEQMNNNVDSRAMLETKNNFVIFSNKNENYKAFKKKYNAIQVSENFEYRSDKNDFWLTYDDFNRMIKEEY